MKNAAHRIAQVVILLAVLLGTGGCNNPLQVGLGDKVDLDVPDVQLSSHPAGQYLRGTVEIGGEYTDDFEISGITISADGGENEFAATTDPTDRTWTYALDTTAYPDGETELLITITDESGKAIQKRVLYYFDNTAPLVMVKNPQAYESNIYNGTLTVRGEAADRFGIDEVALQLLDESGEPLSGFDIADGTNSWAFEFDSRLYADPSGTIQVQVRAMDRAGNESTVLLHYDDVLARNAGAPITIEDVLRIASSTQLDGVTITQQDITEIQMEAVPFTIDNDLDKPTISILTPNNGQNIGGSIMATGTAFDDDGVQSVEMRLDLNGDGDYDDAFDIDGEAGTTGTFETESTWETLSGTTLWTQVLNADGELYQVESGHEGRVLIQIRATDINGTVGNPVEIAIRFDDTIPRVEALNYVTGDYVGGVFTLTGDVHDDEGIDRLQISYDGGISYYDMFNRDQGTNDGSITENADNDFTMAKPINTANIPGQGAVTAAPLYLRLLVTDNADYQAVTYLTLNVDNVYPTNAPDGFTANAMNIRGTDALVQGTAEDAGAISGIESVDVYFVRGGQIFNFDTGSFEAAGTRDFGDGDNSVAYIPAGGTASDYLIQIDDADELGNGDNGPLGDNDGFNESISISGSTYTWYAEFDSTAITDGAIEVHYVINDSAGNGNHYVESGFVKNNYPAFGSVVIGTDINGVNGTGDAGERTTFADPISPLATGFTGRNNLLYVELNGSGGNAPLAYSLGHEGGPNLISSGNSVEIDTSSGYADGTHTFTATITDNVGITETFEFTVEIDNVDNSPPAVTVDTLTQSHVKETGGVPDGHLEEATQSGDGEADVSGVIVLTGSVHDDQVIDEITLTITGYDAGSGSGTAHTVASWNAGLGALEEQAATGTFTITNESLTEDGGHMVDWTYEWNSADIDNVAELDREITITAYDQRTPTANTGSASLTVDVVPYIERIDTALSGKLDDTLARTAHGAYPISNGETVTVVGYNLNPTVDNGGANSDARLSIDTDALDGTMTKVGEGLTYSGAGSPYTSVDMTVSATGSGYLTVFTNGVPSSNNINSSSPQNLLSSPVHVELTDDTYVALWDLTVVASDLGVALADNAVYPSMALDGDTVAFAYVNNAEGYGQARYLYNTTDKQIMDVWDLFTYTAIDFNTVGNHATLYDINVVNGNFGDNNSGNYGGIVTSFYYDVPAHGWGNYDFVDNTIWLDNLVDATDPKTTAVLDRYQYPSMQVVGTTDTTRVFYSVYDRLEDEIIFRTFRVGTDNTIDDSSGGRVNNTGTALYTDIPQYEADGTMPEYNGDDRFTNSNVAGRSPRAADGADVTVFTPSDSFGDHTAVAPTPDGRRAALLYVDEAGAGSLMYRYTPNLDDFGTWSAPVTIATNAGFEFLDMEIDPNGVVHIGYYDSYAGDVHYVQLADYTGASATNTLVDSYLIVGDKLSLSVADYDADGTIEPFLSYKGIGATARAAWLTSASPDDGVDGSDRFDGDWEVQTLPVQVVDSDSNRFNIGVRQTDDRPVVGYTDSGLQYQRLLPELSN